MRFILLFAMILHAVLTPAQNLTGIWRGKRTQNPGGCFPEYSLELHITWNGNNSILGNAYNYYDRERYTKINFTGRYNPQTKRMVIIENAVLQYNIPPNCVPCIKTYDLNWSKDAVEEALSGSWKGHKMNATENCPTGMVHLTKETESIFPVDVQQNDTLLALQKNLRLQPREKEVVKSVILDTGDVKIELYDNAEIDDDTVTVLLNNTLLLYKKRLTDKPLTTHFTAFPNQDYELMMYADNLGRIPPNTSLMIITAGKKRYEMRISSSEQKTAVVKLRYETKAGQKP